MPIAVIFASGLTTDSHRYDETTQLRESFLRQAYEILMDGGMVVFQHVDQKNIDFATDLGFQVALQRKYYDDHNRIYVYNVILRRM